MPHYGNPCAGAMKALYQQPCRPGVGLQMIVAESVSSLLAQGFNSLWCAAATLRARGTPISHFAMLHSDVEPSPAWLSVLMEELEATGADVISAVVPIKSGHGLTSTAVGRPGDPWNPAFRLTMRQVMRLPETFSAADLGLPDRPLLVNTGCWACRFDPEWIYDFPGFTIRDRLIRFETPEGPQYRAEVEPEDWAASRWWHARGLKVLATRKVSVNHHGRAAFGNDSAWGDRDHDDGLDAAEARALSDRLAQRQANGGA